MENTIHNVNLSVAFRNNKDDLQALTSIICEKFMRHSTIIRHISYNKATEEYKHKISQLMRVYTFMDFYILWGSTVEFLKQNGIGVEYE